MIFKTNQELSEKMEKLNLSTVPFQRVDVFSNAADILRFAESQKKLTHETVLELEDDVNYLLRYAIQPYTPLEKQREELAKEAISNLKKRIHKSSSIKERMMTWLSSR